MSAVERQCPGSFKRLSQKHNAASAYFQRQRAPTMLQSGKLPFALTQRKDAQASNSVIGLHAGGLSKAA